jgi:hypothetical protein
MDCGHSGICYECSQSLWKNGEDCHLCRKPIKEVLQIEKMKDKDYKVIAATFILNNDNIEQLMKEYANSGSNDNGNVEIAIMDFN